MAGSKAESWLPPKEARKLARREKRQRILRRYGPFAVATAFIGTAATAIFLTPNGSAHTEDSQHSKTKPSYAASVYAESVYKGSTEIVDTNKAASIEIYVNPWIIYKSNLGR